MSESQVIALKFRPKTFDQVIGQEAITRTLKNAVANGTLHHAYLFAGARGVGKTTTARILAKALNCEEGPTIDPCGECPQCTDIAGGKSMMVVEIDAASNTGVDNVREVIINSAAFAPPPGRYKIFIVDEVHQLSNQAFNALLKTVEEPPPRVIFIMATTEIQKVPETILSRCQIFEFRTIPLGKIVSELGRIADQLGIKISETALLTIARAGDGSMRDSESALDQVISFAGKEVSDEDVSNALGLVSVETLNATLRAIADQDAGAALRIVDNVVTRGYDLRNYCRDIMAHIRAVLTVKIAGFDHELVQLPQAEAQALTDIANRFSEQDLVRFFSILTKTEQDIRVSPQPRFQLEIGLVKVAHAARLYMLEEALARLEEIQSRLGAGGASLSSGRAVGSQASSPRPASMASSSGERPISQASSNPSPAGQNRPVTPQAPPSREPSRTTAASPRPASSSDDRPMQERRPFADPSPSVSARGAEPPPEPPPLADEPFDQPDPPPVYRESSGGAVEKIIAKLNERRRTLLVGALEHAELSVDGEFFKVSFAPSQASFRKQLESKEKRAQIEQACSEALGRRLTLSITTGAEPGATGTKAIPAEGSISSEERPENHPTVRGFVEKFHGEVIDVLKTES